MQKILVSFMFLFSISAHATGPTPVLGWNVDCNNHCAFSEFPNNCQGVYYYYADGTQSYSSWSTTYNACQEVADLQVNSHVITPNLIQCGCPTPASTPPPNPSTALSNSTRNQLEQLRAQVYSWATCAPDPTKNYADPFHAFTFTDLRSCQYFRKNGIKNTWMSVGGCFKGLNGWDDSSSWHPCDWSGDQLSNTLVNCLAGDKDRCDDIKNSQDPVTGHWYRNVYSRYHPQTSYGQPLSSRDVMMGILGYIAVSHDKEAMRKWLIAIEGNPKSPPMNFFNLCPPRPNIPKPASVSQKDWDGTLPDDRCGITPDAAGLIYKTAIASGLTNADLNAIGSDLYSALGSGSLTTFASVVASAATAPALGPSAYQIGNVADTINVASLVGGAGNSSLTSAAGTINDRTSKINPTYQYLAQNKNPTEYGAYLINKYCKPPRPLWGVYYNSGYQNANNSDSFWNSGEVLNISGYQYLGGWGPYGQKIIANGHECIAWLDMYLGNGNYTEMKCDAGDTFVNGACKKFQFTPPTLAAVYGIDYKFRMGDAKLTYQAIDMMSCPYGGTLELGSWPDYARCVLPSGISPNQVNWNAAYVVDPTESAPGIYYAKVNGGCPYGGTPAGNRCLVMSYAVPPLLQTVHYWVDPNPAYPGIYYAKVNGGCPYGGTAAGANCQVHAFASGVLDPSRSYFTRSNPAYPGVFYYSSQIVPETHVIHPIPNPVPVSIQLNAREMSNNDAAPAPAPQPSLLQKVMGGISK